MFVTNSVAGTVGEYTTSGATVNASLITGLDDPAGIAVSGGDLFVAETNIDAISEYNATTGGLINFAFVTGLSGPAGIAVSGGDLFVTSLNQGTVGEFNATTGATVNASLVTGLNRPAGYRGFGRGSVCRDAYNGTLVRITPRRGRQSTHRSSRMQMVR